MAVNNINTINANVSINRGTHELLDYSSKQLNYSSALTWAQNPYSNAAVGQFIYLEEEETIDDNIYVKGAYVVDAIGENAVLTPLSNGIVGSPEIADTVVSLNQQVNTLKSSKADKFNIGDGLQRTTPTSGQATIFVKVNTDPNNILTVDENGLKVEKPEIPEVAEYTISKLETAEDGYSASYELLKDGTERMGAVINIPKDMVVSGGSVITVDAELAASNPGLIEGAKYIELILADSASDKLYIPVNELVDAYTSGDDYIAISSDNKITLNISKVSETVLADVKSDEEIASALNAVKDIPGIKSDIETIQNELNPEEEGSLAANVNTLKETVGDETEGLVKTVADLSENMSDIETGVSELKTTVDGLDATKINVTKPLGTIASAGDSTEKVLEDIIEKVDDIEKTVEDGTGVISIKEGDGISVDATDAANPTVALKLDSSVSNEVASLSENGLVIVDMRPKWIKF